MGREFKSSPISLIACILAWPDLANHQKNLKQIMSFLSIMSFQGLHMWRARWVVTRLDVSGRHCVSSVQLMRIPRHCYSGARMGNPYTEVGSGSASSLMACVSKMPCWKMPGSTSARQQTDSATSTWSTPYTFTVSVCGKEQLWGKSWAFEMSRKKE